MLFIYLTVYRNDAGSAVWRFAANVPSVFGTAVFRFSILRPQQLRVCDRSNSLRRENCSNGQLAYRVASWFAMDAVSSLK